jgi:putative tryptophan/tyrosine transport system substrate-binding protein
VNPMERRDFITLLGGAAVAQPLAARAQSADRVRRTGILMNLAESDPEGQARLAAFRQGLSGLRWREGGNLRTEYRWWGAGDTESLRGHASELVRRAPDVILASGSRALQALQQETRSIPIVFVVQANPIGQAIIQSLARPGGNSTGFSQYETTLIEKLLELLRETAPGIARVLVMFHPDNPAYSNPTGYLRSFDAVVRTFGLAPVIVTVQDATQIERAFAEFAREPNGGLLLPPDGFTLTHRERIIALAAQHRLPGIYSYPIFTRSGGLMSYGVDLDDLYRRAAAYVDRILKGEKPGELPVQAPTRFEFMVNLKVAKALGLDLQPMLLARADEVVE